MGRILAKGINVSSIVSAEATMFHDPRIAYNHEVTSRNTRNIFLTLAFEKTSRAFSMRYETDE